MWFGGKSFLCQMLGRRSGDQFIDVFQDKVMANHGLKWRTDTLFDEEINVCMNRFAIKGLKVEELLQTIAPTHWLQRTVVWDTNTTVLLIDFTQHWRPPQSKPKPYSVPLFGGQYDSAQEFIKSCSERESNLWSVLKSSLSNDWQIY